jgi:hypothetical protein
MLISRFEPEADSLTVQVEPGKKQLPPPLPLKPRPTVQEEMSVQQLCALAAGAKAIAVATIVTTAKFFILDASQREHKSKAEPAFQSRFRLRSPPVEGKPPTTPAVFIKTENESKLAHQKNRSFGHTERRLVQSYHNNFAMG